MKIVFTEKAKERLQDYLYLIFVVVLLYFVMPKEAHEHNMRPFGVDVIADIGGSHQTRMWEVETGFKQVEFEGNSGIISDNERIILWCIIGFVLLVVIYKGLRK